MRSPLRSDRRPKPRLSYAFTPYFANRTYEASVSHEICIRVVEFLFVSREGDRFRF